MKIYIYAINTEELLKGDLRYCLTASSNPEYGSNRDKPDWPLIAEVDFDEESLDVNKLTKDAVECLTIAKQERLAKANIEANEIDDRIQSLLAITHQPMKAVK